MAGGPAPLEKPQPLAGSGRSAAAGRVREPADGRAQGPAGRKPLRVHVQLPPQVQRSRPLAAREPVLLPSVWSPSRGRARHPWVPPELQPLPLVGPGAGAPALWTRLLTGETGGCHGEKCDESSVPGPGPPLVGASSGRRGVRRKLSDPGWPPAINSRGPSAGLLTPVPALGCGAHLRAAGSFLPRQVPPRVPCQGQDERPASRGRVPSSWASALGWGVFLAAPLEPRAGLCAPGPLLPARGIRFPGINKTLPQPQGGASLLLS